PDPLSFPTRRSSDLGEAEDAVQDIFVRGYVQIGAYEPSGTFSSWLYKLAYHHCLNEIKRREGGRRRFELLKLRRREEMGAHRPTDRKSTRLNSSHVK